MDSQGHDTSGEHLVQFYENDAFLIEGITDYIGSAIAAGDKAIVIATKPHLHALEEKLKQRGLLQQVRSNVGSNYIPIEAHKMLPLFMVNDMPDETLFTSVIGGVIADAAAAHQGRICVFGEMVAILCGEQGDALRSDRKHAAAIHVEKCFNKLLMQHLRFGEPIAKSVLWLCCLSTSTTSKRSMTPLVITPVTSCLSRWRGDSRRWATFSQGRSRRTSLKRYCSRPSRIIGNFKR